MLRLIRDLLRPYRWLLMIVVVASLVQAGMGLAGPWPLKIIMDSAIGNQPVPLWATWFSPALAHGGKMQIAALAAIIVIVLAVVGAVASYSANYFVESVGQRVANDLRMRAYHHLQRLSLSYFQTHQVGTIMSTITTDVATIQDFASKSIVNVFVDILTVIGMVFVMFSIRWDFALFAVALLPFLFYFVSRVRRAIAKKILELRKIQADMMAVAQESLESMEVVEAFELEDCEETQLGAISRQSVQAAMKARRSRAMLRPVVGLPIALCTAFVLWHGASLILSGAMTIGLLTVFIVYLNKFFDPVQDLSLQADSFAQTSVAAQRIQAILDADAVIPERPDAIDPPPFRGEIGFEHVAFGYDADHSVLRDVNLTIKPGEMVGVVGGTGSGKSTVVSLIPRFCDPRAGAITIDGGDIRGFKLHGLRSQIAFVLQETVLCRGTVRDNIALGRPGATEDEIIQAAKLANADEFISRMPLGYDTEVGERGSALSGGQRQRIGIARALIRNAPILILDEPTAALDAESEKLVIEAMERLMKGRTVICIAHRLSTIRNANKIIVIKGGVVAEQGSHEELITLNGDYAELHRIQFQGSAGV